MNKNNFMKLYSLREVMVVTIINNSYLLNESSKLFDDAKGNGMKLSPKQALVMHCNSLIQNGPNNGLSESYCAYI